MDPNPTPPRVRLAFGRFFWRLAAMLTLLGELALWGVVRNRIPRGRRMQFFLALNPRLLFSAFLFAAVVSVLADAWVRFVVRPLVLSWYTPRSTGDGGSFHLGPREAVVAQTVARRSDGWLWPVGRLVLTDQRLWFFPDAWDAEPWCLPRGGWQEVEVMPAPRIMLGMIVDLPGRIRLRVAPDAAEVFAVAEPSEVRTWLAPAASTQAAPA